MTDGAAGTENRLPSEAAGTGFLEPARAAARAVGGPAFAAIVFAASLFVASLFVLRADKVFDIPSSVEEVRAEDLVAFWRGGQMALEGRAADAYDAGLFREGLPAGGQGLHFRNPPHFFLLIAPLGLAPYGVAKAIWLAISLAALTAIAWLASAPQARPLLVVAILLSPAAFASLLVLQIGPPIALGLLAALLLSRDRPIAAGVILAFLTMKPQYGLLVPVFLAARGEWRTIAAAAAATAALCALSAALFGAEAWAAFFNSLGGLPNSHGAVLHRDLLTVNQAIGKVGGEATLRAGGQIAATAFAAIGTFIAARRWKREDAVGFALLASAVASPSMWVYDWGLIAAGLFLLARAGRRWPLGFQSAAGFAWIAPLLPLGLLTPASAALATGALVLAAMLAFIWLQGAQGSSLVSGSAGSAASGGSATGSP